MTGALSLRGLGVESCEDVIPLARFDRARLDLEFLARQLPQLRDSIHGMPAVGIG
jgi:hypothetical protein